jgi:hypothetical protein
MIKILKVLTLFGVLIASTQVKAQDDTATKNGFSINVELGILSGSYGSAYGTDRLGSGLNYGLQVGNRGYLKRFGEGGFALMTNWFSYNMSIKNTETIKSTTIEMTFIEIGAMYSHPLNDDMAIDGYYNLEPTLIGTATVNKKDDGQSLAGFGVGHVLGAAFRYKVFNLGLEYHLGSITGTYAGIGSINDADLITLGKTKVSTSLIKIVLGVKF